MSGDALAEYREALTAAERVVPALHRRCAEADARLVEGRKRMEIRHRARLGAVGMWAGIAQDSEAFVAKATAEFRLPTRSVEPATVRGDSAVVTREISRRRQEADAAIWAARKAIDRRYLVMGGAISAALVLAFTVFAVIAAAVN